MTSPDLTLWLVSPSDGEDMLTLGRDAAESESIRFMASPDVLSVACTPLVHASHAEMDALASTWTDLGAPLLPLAQAAGLDVDPENFDPYALLLALREGQSS
jgi:hypothetical protein